MNLNHHCKVALRNLCKGKTYFIINILGLALGLACVILIALWVRDEMRQDSFHENKSQLYRVMANTYWGDQATINSVPAPLNKVIKEEIPEVQFVTTITEDRMLVTAGNTSFKEAGIYATGDMLHMFSFPLLEGDLSTALSSPNNVVITEELARKHFGTTAAIGKTLKINNADIFKVTGILKKIPVNSSLRFDLLLPFKSFERKNSWLKGWGNFSVSMYVMLKPNTAIEKVDARLRHILKTKKNPDTKDEIFLQAFSDMYLYSDFEGGKPVRGRIEYVRLFSLIAFFVLLIACVNYINLATARSAKRAREVGIRKVIGAKRTTLITQFMTEAFVLTLLSIVLSLIIVWLLLPYYNQLTSKELSIDFLDNSFLATIATIAVLTTLFSGAYPALFLSSFKPVTTLKAASGNISLRKILVVAQFTLSVILISGTLIIYKQVQYLKNKHLGIDEENVIIIPVEGEIGKHLDAFQHRLSRLPAIKSVTVSTDNPLNIQVESSDLEWPGKFPVASDRISATWVGYNYLQTIGVPLIKGRDFDKGQNDKSNYIINETAARMMNLKDPIGQTVTFWKGKGQIIGVMKDFHIKSLHEPISPLILVLDAGNASYILVKTQNGKTSQAIEDIQQVYKEYNPAYPFEYHFLDQQYEQRYKNEILIGSLSNAFAMLTITISCLGLFGLAAFTTEQRIREIGIRKVLGAKVLNITSLLTKDFIKLVILSILIAVPIALWATTRWLENFAYHVEASWKVFALSGIIAVLVAVFTVSFQAIKAAMVNPIKSLRTE
jgi:putative ABC transport system permease protein